MVAGNDLHHGSYRVPGIPIVHLLGVLTTAHVSDHLCDRYYGHMKEGYRLPCGSSNMAL